MSEIENDIVIEGEEIFEEYSQDLKNYIKFLEKIKTKDTFDYIRTYRLYRLAEKWKPRLGFDEGTISKHILDMQTPKVSNKVSLSIRELLDEAESESSWLIPTLLQSSGMYILGGEPKTGKSILAYALSYAVAVSGEFLGLPVRKGKVLFLQLEEPLPTMKKRFKLAGFGNLESNEDASLVVNFKTDNIRIERNFDITTDVNWLIKKINQYKPDLVIIDSLRKATVKSSYSENTNEYGKLVYTLQQVFNTTNTCGLVIHHLSKCGDGKKKYNLIERLAGHTSISAASDGIIGLFEENNPDGRFLKLNTRPRDGFSVSISYKSNITPEGLWSFERTEGDSPAQLIATSQILRLLSTEPDEFLSTIQIAKELKISITNPKFTEALQYLVDLEIIKVKYIDKKRYYSMPSSGLWLVSPVSIKSLVSSAVLDANSLMMCSSKSKLRNLVQDWDTSRRRDSFVVLLPGEKLRIENLIKDWEFSIGDEVYLDNTDTLYTISEYIGEAYSLDENLYLISDGKSSYECQENRLKLKEVSYLDEIEIEEELEELKPKVFYKPEEVGNTEEEEEEEVMDYEYQIPD